MNSRKTKLANRLGVVADLPLLVPSFSSKGFAYFVEMEGTKKHTFSETSRALESLGQYLKESFLISAYDLHHKHFKNPEHFFSNTEFIFLDSGGYELAPEFDSTEPKLTPVRELQFGADEYHKLLKRFYSKFENLPFVITNFDWETRNHPFEDQVKNARRLFGQFPNWMNNFLIKPQKQTSKVLHIDKLLPHLDELRNFDIIGVTEKELGKNLIDRLKLIARLRAELSRREISAPIHVWGGLDPVITPLYYFAGADIFDGVSWLRYAYHKGMSVSRGSSSILDGALEIPHDHAVFLALNQNLIALQGLATSLRAFANSAEPNFDVFDHNGDVFKKAYLKLCTKVPDVKEFA